MLPFPKPEILAPAGDLPSLEAALSAGADAIYLGLSEGFNARAKAANFCLDALPELVAEVHANDARLYVTLNTLVFDSEHSRLSTLLTKIGAAGVDAIIFQDLAVAILARALVPQVALHASTQRTVLSPDDASLLETLGVSRVVLPRELTLAQLASFKARSNMELECFVHGALCISVSGQCSASFLGGGRSANRGQCTQPCRLAYSEAGQPEAYALSPRDLWMPSKARALWEAGLRSLKIEGRMKGPAYVAAAVALWREALDAVEAGREGPCEAAQQRVQLTFSRTFTEGLMHGERRLVRGDSPRHSGIFLGYVAWRHGRELGVRPRAGAPRLHSLASLTSCRLGAWPVPPTCLRPGMGILIRGEGVESGGPLFSFSQEGELWRLGFGRPGPDLERVEPGMEVYWSGDPGIERWLSGLLSQPRRPVWPYHLKVSGGVGRELELELVFGNARLRLASQQACERARDAGIDEAMLRARFGEFLARGRRVLGDGGARGFVLAGVDLSGLDDDCFLPPSELKRLRRAMLEALQQAAQAAWVGDKAEKPGAAVSSVQVLSQCADGGLETAGAQNASVEERWVLGCTRLSQLELALSCGWREFELDFLTLEELGEGVRLAREAGAKLFLACQRAPMEPEEELGSLLALQPDGLLLRTWGSLGALRRLGAMGGLELQGDWSLQVANGTAARWALSMGLEGLTPALEVEPEQSALVHSFGLARPSQRCAGASDAPATDADSCLASLTCLHSFALARPSQRCAGASDAPATDADSCLASLTSCPLGAWPVTPTCLPWSRMSVVIAGRTPGFLVLSELALSTGVLSRGGEARWQLSPVRGGGSVLWSAWTRRLAPEDVARFRILGVRRFRVQASFEEGAELQALLRFRETALELSAGR
ncbi:MAG: U32 family peptidase [Myxococcota bacterium]|nr:U32 family peptidase [Myxococcota bacterium]